MYKRGTIVLVPFPFTDLSGNKVRPAVIVSHNIAGEDVIVVFISSAKRGGRSDTKVLPSKENGLKTASYIKCSKIATLDKKIILGELGLLSVVLQREVDKNLKNIFKLH